MSESGQEGEVNMGSAEQMMKFGEGFVPESAKNIMGQYDQLKTPQGEPEKDRIEGSKPGETWATWMIPSKDEFETYGEGAKDYARKIARRPDVFITSDTLMQSYEELLDLSEKGKISEDEEIMFAHRLSQKAEELQEGAKKPTSGSSESSTDNLSDQLSQAINGLNQSINDLNTSFTKGLTAPDVYLERMEEQNKGMAEVFKSFGERTPPDVERSRWVDMEYRQEFYTQFDPRSEPYFYRYMEDEEERRTWDFRWRLARIAFYKKATNALPEKYRDSQDVTLFTNEMISAMLERVEGSKEMMTGYLEDILHEDSDFWELARGEKEVVNPYKKDKDGKPVYEVQEMNTVSFEEYRKSMQKKNRTALKVRLSDPNDIAGIVFPWLSGQEKDDLFGGLKPGDLPDDFMAKMNTRQLKSLLGKLSEEEIDALSKSIPDRENIRKNGKKTQDIEDWLDLKIKEADAVAWNTIYVSNVVEWADSRYTINKKGGGRSINPLVLVTDDYRSVHHPQEKWEDKSLSGHLAYSPLVEWCTTQLEKIKKATNIHNKAYYEVEPAVDESSYWKTRLKDGFIVDRETKEKKYVKKIVVSIPEVTLPTTVNSFLHETGVIYWDKTKEDWDIDLEKFRTFKPDYSGTEAEHPFGLWVATKFHKAIQFNEYYLGKQPLDFSVSVSRLGPTVRDWVLPLLELHKRLRPTETIDTLKERGLTHLDYDFLKKMAVYASTGGMFNPNDRLPTTRMRMFTRRSDVLENLRLRNYEIKNQGFIDSFSGKI